MDEKTQKKLKVALNISTLFDSSGVKWFLCFGTLLSFVRDKKFNIDQDVDIGVIGSGNYIASLVRTRHEINHVVRDDHTQEIVNFNYIDGNNVVIDVFVWRKWGGMCWHTYDTLMQNTKSGFLSEYVWKGIRSSVFETDPKVIEKRQQDLKYGRVMKSDGTWRHALPECPGEGVELCLPDNYGSFLDYAYPDWCTERKQFGVSECEAIKKVKTCKGLY